MERPTVFLLLFNNFAPIQNFTYYLAAFNEKFFFCVIWGEEAFQLFNISPIFLFAIQQSVYINIFYPIYPYFLFFTPPRSFDHLTKFFLFA